MPSRTRNIPPIHISLSSYRYNIGKTRIKTIYRVVPAKMNLRTFLRAHDYTNCKSPDLVPEADLAKTD